MDGIDLFAEYIVDRDKGFLIYDEKKRGFVTFSFPPRSNTECFIEDLFVLPKYRLMSVCLGMMKQVIEQAKKHGRNTLTCAVSINNPDADKLLKAYLYYGMKPIATNVEFIYLAKGI